MDAVTLAAARAATVRALKPLRRREIPGQRAFPALMASPPTAATYNTTSQITSGVFIPPDLGNFTVLGGNPQRGVPYPDYLGIFTTAMYGVTTPSPYVVDFILDTADATGRFEVLFKRNTNGARLLVMVNGQWQYATVAETVVGSGNDIAYGLVTLGAPGSYRLRLECHYGFQFGGLQIGPTDSVTPADAPRRRVVVIGDSITEPTVTDTGAHFVHDGWAQVISYGLNADVWTAGSGGTGYLQPNTGATPSRSKLAGRLSEILPYVAGAEVWVALGINDYGNFTAAAIGAEALSDFQAILAAGASNLVVLSPFWPRSTINAANGLFAARDAIRTSAATVGATFIDILAAPQTTPAPTTLAAPLTANSSSTLQTVGNLGARDYWVQIGTGATAEVRYVSFSSGTGPYTYAFGATNRGGPVSNAHSAGEPVIVVSPPYITGNGNQGNLKASGTADRYTGNDATHPTVAGHRQYARTILAAYMRTLTP